MIRKSRKIFVTLQSKNARAQTNRPLNVSNNLYSKYLRNFLVVAKRFGRLSAYKEILFIIYTMRLGIDIFSGAGGLSLGAEMAGIEVKYAIEINKSAAATFKKNHPNAEVLCNDIREIKVEQLNFNGKQVFIIMGGPPCQGFSLSNTRTRNMDNPNNILFQEFVRLVRDIKPVWFVFENVWGITNINNGEVMRQIKSCFEEIGYTVAPKVLKASDYGVPQCRERFFMVGNNLGIDFEFPDKLSEIVTVQDAISDLPILFNGQSLEVGEYRCSKSEATPYQKLMRKHSRKPKQNYVSRNNDLVIERYKHIPQGGNWRDIPDELMRNYADKARCHSGIYKRLRPDCPSVVISNYRKSMLIHPYQDRGLSVREAARIQSFPDDFIFEGPISHIQQQIGNAVPPLLAKAVIEQIIKTNMAYEQGHIN